MMDDPYFREFHREWVRALGKGWRTSRRMAVGLVIASFVLVIAGWSTNSPQLKVFAFVSFALGVLVVVAFVRRRAAWLQHCRLLPGYGKVLRIEVRDGDLVQVKDYPGDPKLERTGALVLTSSGYLVRYRGVIEHTNQAVSTTTASVYIPHRAIVPAMSREAFLANLRFLDVTDG